MHKRLILTFTTVICIVTIAISQFIGCTLSTPSTPQQPSPARDLTGTWSGSGVYYQLNLNGDRVLKVTCNVVMTLQQSDGELSGILDVYPTKQEPTGLGSWVPEVEGHSTVDGNAVITTLTFNVGSKVTGIKEKWEFTFTSDLMNGHVTNLDTNYYSGRDSDFNAFKLVREGSEVPTQTESTTPTTTSPAPPLVLPLPSGISPKPSSLQASNAEYYLIYTIYNSWFGEGSFITGYEKYSNEGIVNNWTVFWIGSEEDETQRFYFDRVDSQWKPRAIPPLPPGIPPKPSSLLASNAEYYLIYTIYNSWFGEGSFITGYEKYSNEGIVNNWTVFWIGSEEDETQRFYFDRVDNQWKPRSMSEPLTYTPTTPPPTSTVQIWEIVDETGHTAILTVDSNGNFSGSGWTGITPTGTYDIPITNGVMSGTSMRFDANASYDGGQGNISGTGNGTLNEPFPLAQSASGTWSGTISDPLGTRNFSIRWTATRRPE